MVSADMGHTKENELIQNRSKLLKCVLQDSLSEKFNKIHGKKIPLMECYF